MQLLYWTAFIVFVVDQASKWVVVQWLDLPNTDEGRISILPGLVEFRTAWNRGVNFGLFAEFDMRWVLIVVSIAIVVAVLIWLHRTRSTRLGYIAGGLLVGGALGNVIDRVAYGAVADFLNVTCCGYYNPYAFNVADIAIFAGAVGLAFLPDPKAKKAASKK
ncbi:signal peptidase II [Cognatiyoonia sp.]|uniref:signal peptidase II n=1 Tax=Cognatiyoonia sp. TaxID=2211652 RepID=UPI003F69F1AF